MSSHSKGVLAQIIAAVIWGIAGPVVKIVLNSVPAFPFVFLRLAIAVLILTPIVIKKNLKLRLGFIDFLQLVVMGLLAITFNIGLYFWGQSYTSVIDAAVILSTTSIFTAIGAFLFLGERKSKIVLFGIFISFLGTIIIIIQPILENGLFQAKNMLGNILILFATLSWVAYTILAKEIKQKYDTLTKTYFFFLVGVISFLPLVYKNIFDLNFYLNFQMSTVLGILFEGIFASVIAYTLFNWSLKFVSATKSGVISYLIPITSIIISILFLGEKFSTFFLIGAGISAIGIFLAEIRQPLHPLHHLHKKSK